MKGLHMISFILLIIGGINWLLVGLVGWDIGQLFGGMDAGVSRVIYILVGLAAIAELVTHKHNCRACKKKDVSAPSDGQGGGQQM